MFYNLLILGLCSFLLGILMSVFHNPIGKAFSKGGKYCFRNTCAKDMAESIYDEEGAGNNMLALGLIFILQGMLLCIGTAVYAFCVYLS